MARSVFAPSKPAGVGKSWLAFVAAFRTFGHDWAPSPGLVNFGSMSIASDLQKRLVEMRSRLDVLLVRRERASGETPSPGRDRTPVSPITTRTRWRSSPRTRWQATQR